MKTAFRLELVLILAYLGSSQYSTLVINVVELSIVSNHTFVYNVSPSTNLTRWTYLVEPTVTSLVSYQNGKCTVSPSGNFLGDGRYSFTCNSTAQFATLHLTGFIEGLINRIISCRDALQPDETGSTWIIKKLTDTDNSCSYCEPTMAFGVKDISEGDNATFLCRVSSDVPYVNWKRNIGSNTVSMGVQNEKCTTQGTTFLDDTSKYKYTCNDTVYQVTILNVQRSEHNDIYMCTPLEQTDGTGSNWIIKVVKAQVTSVTITPPGYLINVTENTPIEFTCTTSTARPAATIYWYRHPNGQDSDETQITDNITTTTDYNDLSVITSKLRLFVTRQDNDTKVFCRANNAANTTKLVSINKRLLNVIYKADDPYIPKEKEYQVIENAQGTLACTVKGGNPTPTLTWECNGVSLTNKATVSSNITITTLVWTPLRTHDGTCTCTSKQTGFQDTTVDVTLHVLFRVTSVLLTQANSQIDVKENTAVQFTCTTSTSRPAASVYWYMHQNRNSNDISRIIDNITTTTDYNDFSVITSTLHFVPKRQHNNTKIYCEANNSVNTSPVKSNKILLNVQYKAEDLYIVQGKEYRVIENTPGTLSCTVRVGNPTPTLSWSCTNFSPTNQSTINLNGSTTTTLTWTPTKTHGGKCTCTSKQTNFKTETKDVSIVVLYPPSKPIFKVNGTSIDGNISFIEGTTRSITCTSDSKPSPDRYTWTGISDIDSPNQPILSFNIIEKVDAGEYGCIAQNTMNSSDERPVKRSNNSTVNIVVLYNPVALPINNTSVIIGKNLTIKCPYTSGMPSETSFVWTRNTDDEQWNGELLNIPYVEKSDAANYFCNVSNVMMPSGESITYIGDDTQSFFLDVLYEAIVTWFTINGIESTTVTKNESDPVQFACKADSNPIANMTLGHNNKLLKTELSNMMKHDINQAGCLDAGKYVCYAKNVYNTILSASEEVQLFVNCYPRTENEIKGNITSEKNATITITLDVIAYPPPTFIWYKLIDEEWTLLHDNKNNSINISAVQTNLTIQSVGPSDFTSYKVHAKNDFGEMDQLYYLSPHDKPDPPINFTHIESRTTTSLIHLVWTPGFDNGPPQTFYIKYKKSSDNVWIYRDVSDNGEPTMDLLLTDLTENTKYEFVIFASNEKGNSSELSFTATTLKAIKNSSNSPGALIGGLTGGISGVVIIVIVIIVIIRRYPLLKGWGNADQDMRRPDSDDSDDEDGLVDNPMYASSSNVAPVASTSASTSTDIYAKPVKPKKPIVPSKGDVYAVVDKTKKLEKGKNGKTAPGNSKQQEADVYENFELDNKPKEKEVDKHDSPGEPASKQPKLKIFNKDGLIYADLLFNGKPPGEKMVIIGDDPTPYSQVDFTKKADPLPESDEEDENK